MSADHDSRTWEILARQDPYWAVVTDEKHRLRNFTEEARREFFQGGVDHVAHVFETIRRYLTPDFKPRSALEFGCGVGRVLIPLAERCERVVGVDVSDTMLQEARSNCERRGLANIALHRLDDMAAMGGPFDLIHSFIVFQHISPQRGEALFLDLIRRLAPGGVGAFHFTYSPKRERPALRRWLGRMTRRLRGTSVPVMEMYPYRINPLLRAMQEHGVARFHAEMTDHGYYGTMFFFQKP